MSTDLTLAGRAVEVQRVLYDARKDFADICPNHLTPEQIIQVAMTCFYRTPGLLECESTSLKVAAIQAASLGLDLSPAAGEAYLIPRYNGNIRAKEAQFQPGYRGLMKLARRAGGLRYIQAELVHKDDQFECWRDPDWRLIHKPSFGSKTQVTHVYAVAKLETGELQLTVMCHDEIEAIRNRSQSPHSGPWKDHWGEMAKKTAVKRLCKTLPFNADSAAVTQLNAAIEADNREYEGEPDSHHAKHYVGNDTGHGIGAYAKPADVRAMEAWLRAKVDDLNSKWADYWIARKVMDVGDFITTHVLAVHLYTWARSVGLVEGPAVVKSRSNDYLATAWLRSREEVEEEALRFSREQWGAAVAKARVESRIDAEQADDASQIAAVDPLVVAIEEAGFLPDEIEGYVDPTDAG